MGTGAMRPPSTCSLGQAGAGESGAGATGPHPTSARDPMPQPASRQHWARLKSEAGGGTAGTHPAPDVLLGALPLGEEGGLQRAQLRMGSGWDW